MQKDKEIEWDYRNEINKPLQAGTILLAEPFSQDPYFSRSVSLIVNHQKEEGTFGFTINKKSKLKLSDVLEIDCDWSIYEGGPVGENSLFYIHNNSFQLKDALQITDNLYWNGDYKELSEKILNGEIHKDDIRFIKGYSGWDSGQLRREIIENSWIVNNDYKTNLLNPPKNLWKQTLHEMEGIYAKFATFPISPNLN